MAADFEHSPRPTCPRFDPLDPVHQANPYPTYAALRRDAPVFYDPRFDVWVVTRYADIAAALKRPEIFSSNGALSASGVFSHAVQAVLAGGVVDLAPILTETDGPDHARIRSVLNQSFTQKRVADLEPHVREIADQLIDGFVGDGKADLSRQFAVPLTGLVICDLLGLPHTDLQQLKAWNEDWLTLLSATASEQERIRCAQSVVAHQRYLHQHFRDRRKNPRDDLLTAMLPREWGGTAPLSPGEAVYNVIDSVTAGSEPTEKMITNAVVALFEHHEQRARLQADSVLPETAVEEILRFANPVQGLFRVTTCEVQISGVVIPADERVFLMYASANHDEGFFENADRLDIGRPLTRDHMTFAHGIHVCLGAALVRMEVRIALELLLRRLPNLRPAADVNPQRMHHFWLNGYRTMPVEWDPS